MPSQQQEKSKLQAMAIKTNDLSKSLLSLESYKNKIYVADISRYKGGSGRGYPNGRGSEKEKDEETNISYKWNEISNNLEKSSENAERNFKFSIST